MRKKIRMIHHLFLNQWNVTLWVYDPFLYFEQVMYCKESSKEIPSVLNLILFNVKLLELDQWRNTHVWNFCRSTQSYHMIHTCLYSFYSIPIDAWTWSGLGYPERFFFFEMATQNVECRCLVTKDPIHFVGSFPIGAYPTKPNPKGQKLS